jgi:nitroimidazol reductase NimA-like FMN-containing flavoprotein (pyridoxamine 5'-phosphate oxidase superfamily)
MTRAVVTDPHAAPVGALLELSADECWELVRSCSVGRFAVNRLRAGPLVVPVNYVVEGDGPSIVFRSGAGTKLNATSHGLVAVQVDAIDPIHHTGWSVLVEGTAGWLFEEQDDAVVESWAPGDRPYLVRLRPTRVTGRRLDLPQLETDGRGYR